MSHITANNYKKGDPFPPRTNTNLLRVYSIQVCPYAERALLTLVAKDIEHEVINIKLRADLPEWLLERNPLGKVPVIEFDHDNKVLYESLIVAEYLDEAHPDKRRLLADTPYQRANDRVFIETFNAQFGSVYKHLYATENLATVWSDITDGLRKVDKQLAKRRGNNQFLSGAALPGLVDYAVWPFINRLVQLIDLAGHDSGDFLPKELPTVHDYRQQLLSDPTVQKVSLTYDQLLDFTRYFRSTFFKK